MNHTTTTAYDADGRKTSVTDNLSHSTSFSYDNDGNLLVTTDPLTHTVTNVFDSRGRITSSTDSLSGVTSYTYDGVGNVLTLKDPDNNTTMWTYNALNRVLTDTDQLNHTRSYSYDASGDLTSETDRDGRVRDFTFDNLHRETSEQWMSGGVSVYTISYSYDAANQVTSAADPDSSYAYQYDDLGRVTSVDNNGTPAVPRVVLSSQYDSMNDRTQLAATIAGTADFLNTYQYDADQRLTQLVQQGQTGGNAVATKGADLYYNALGQITKIFRTNFFGVGPQPDIATSNLSYDAGNRLTQIAYTDNGGTAIDAYSWTYDAANRVTSMTTTTDGTATYSYDNTNQVTGATYTGTGQPANETYSYDSNGNRTNTGYSTGTNNQLSSDGTFNYTYDAEGNRTSRTRISNAPANDYKTTYSWDYRDRLTDVDFYNNSNVLTKHVHYTYDVFDHRISKSLDATGSGSYSRIEDYVYDGLDVVLDFVDPDGAGAQPLALATRYLNGPGNAGATDQVFAQEDESTSNVLWLLADNLGTTRDVVDNSSVLAAHEVYNSFGQLVSGPTNVTPYLYTGQMWDVDIGLQYNWRRWYDPAVGRWISEDPTEFTAGDPNLSRYVDNSAADTTDFSGLQGNLGPAIPWWERLGYPTYRAYMLRQSAKLFIPFPGGPQQPLSYPQQLTNALNHLGSVIDRNQQMLDSMLAEERKIADWQREYNRDPFQIRAGLLMGYDLQKWEAAAKLEVDVQGRIFDRIVRRSWLEDRLATAKQTEKVRAEAIKQLQEMTAKQEQEFEQMRLELEQFQSSHH